MLQAVADHYKFDLSVPFVQLDEAAKDIVLYGSKGTSLNFKYINDRGDIMERKHPFEGIIPNMERRYKETESNAVRDELSKYLSKQHCSTCSGSRLRLEARNVFIGETPINTITDMSISDALAFFSLILP